VNGIIIWTTTQLQIEEAVISENANRFSLALSSPIFDRGMIERIGTMGQALEVYELIHYNTLIYTANPEVN